MRLPTDKFINYFNDLVDGWRIECEIYKNDIICYCEYDPWDESCCIRYNIFDTNGCVVFYIFDFCHDGERAFDYGCYYLDPPEWFGLLAHFMNYEPDIAHRMFMGLHKEFRFDHKDFIEFRFPLSSPTQSINIINKK